MTTVITLNSEFDSDTRFNRELRSDPSNTTSRERLAICTVTLTTEPLVTAGSGYTDAEACTITGVTSGASNATGTLNVTGGAIDSIDITDNGSGYIAGEALTITGDTSAASDAIGIADTSGTDEIIYINMTPGALSNGWDFSKIRNFKQISSVHILNGSGSTFEYQAVVESFDPLVTVNVYDIPQTLSTATSITDTLTIIVRGN